MSEPEYKCDYPKCIRKPFAEVYDIVETPMESKWCYLCFWHFIQERRWRTMWCIVDHWTKRPFMKGLWEWYCNI